MNQETLIFQESNVLVTTARATIGKETIMVDAIQSVEVRKKGGWSNWYIISIIMFFSSGGTTSQGGSTAVTVFFFLVFICSLIAAHREVRALALFLSIAGSAKPRPFLVGTEQGLLERSKQALLDAMIARRAA